MGAGAAGRPGLVGVQLAAATLERDRRAPCRMRARTQYRSGGSQGICTCACDGFERGALAPVERNPVALSPLDDNRCVLATGAAQVLKINAFTCAIRYHHAVLGHRGE